MPGIFTKKMTISWPLLLVLSVLMLSSIDGSFAGDILLNTSCSNTSYAAKNSTYDNNLRRLLSSLNATVTQSLGKTRFFNTTVAGRNVDGSSYTIYGLYLCRGDDSSMDCQTCVPLATHDILQNCATGTEKATIWYVDCMVRYSNEPIFGVMDLSQPIYMINQYDMTTDANYFSNFVGTLLQNLVTNTTTSAKKYATNQAKFNDLITVYVEAQCTPDLTIAQCQRCLTRDINTYSDCCTMKKGARVLNPSCNVRFDVEPFFQNASVPSSPLSLVPSNGVSSQHLPTLSPPTRGKRKAIRYVAIALVALVAILLVQISLCMYLMRRRRKRSLEDAEVFLQNQNQMTHIPSIDYIVDEDFLNVESLQYDLKVLQIATHNFSNENKLGEGGFGGVYKGILPNGQEIAVKRLSVCSNQGVEQFKNEVVFVAKLQHRNLVRLLGYCLAEYEKLLVFEFVPNKSLDYILFDPQRREELDWPTRFKIISGIARGMLYLHEDSRLRIVHRDLKASNILLDADLTAKITDFGTARCFNVDESQGNTTKIAGTFGYMAPEYLLNGEFSLKSDVYSFGVLVLEIVSGRKCTGFRQSRRGEHLLSYAWKHWTEGNPLEIMDSSLGDSYPQNEAIRCIQLGFLCVQGDIEKRPTMASIIFSLNGDMDLPKPQQPGLFICTQIQSRPEIEDLLQNNESISKSMRLSFGSDTSAN